MRRRVFAFLVTTLVTAAAAFAQQGTADLRGRVIDQQGAALPGVTVIVSESGQRAVPRDRERRRRLVPAERR